jgi:peptidyl-prolyl cis-trans isomerase C
MTPRAPLGAALCAALLLSPASLLAQAPAKDGKKPAPAASRIATVNGVAIPRIRAEILARERAAQGTSDNEQSRAAIRDDLINREVVAQEADRAGFTKRPEFQAELALVRQTVIVQGYLRDWVRRNPVSEAEMQKEYDAAKAQTGDKEYHARHILVEKEEEAKGLIAELKKGAKFEDLAEKNSKDSGNKDRGGDLDWNVPGVFDKAFADAMVKLEKGQLTDAPVQTRFGYHIIKLDDVRPVKFPSYAEVKPRIQQQLTQRKVEALVRSLREKAKVE